MKIKIERTIKMKNNKPTLNLHRLIHCRLICCMYCILIDGLEQNEVVFFITKIENHVENHYLTVFRREATCFESQQL